MLNQMVVIGRVNKAPVLNEEDKNNVYSTFQLKVKRPFKNEEGKYDSDYLTFIAYGDLATSTIKFIEESHLLAVKGRIEQESEQIDNNSQNSSIKLIAEKISYL